MNYCSTRDRQIRVSSAKAITQGISQDGGLFVPEEFPKLSMADLQALAPMTYQQRAKRILSLYLTDFTPEEIDYCVDNAYREGNFAHESIAPLAKLSDGTYLLELWHGPTCAFKDMALQILPYLLTVSAKKVLDGQKIVILVATSGDTGKAALEGFKDVDGTQMLVFYPEDGVSPMQKRQMTTQEGENVSVCAIYGNFDDAQTGVKQIFTDPAMHELLKDHQMLFSSANSINWGRLLPQIVYYISAYCELVQAEEIKLGDVMDVAVPTGNFGNILAAYYAKKMGVPIGRLICASNRNNVLTDFIQTGRYNRNRDFYTTISPSMDILISSNLERLLYDLSGEDDEKIRAWFGKLNEEGQYEVDEAVKEALQALFYAGCCDDAKTKATIAKVFGEYSYLCDTHTAVGVAVAEEYQKANPSGVPVVIASTANPYKFAHSVLSAVSDQVPENEYDQIEALEQLSRLPIPPALASLKEKPVRFTQVVERTQMRDVVLSMLHLQ